MKFKISNLDWEIKELSQEEIRETIKQRAERNIEEAPSTGRYFGTTYLDDQVILVDKDLPIDRKRRTLMHELSHAYIGCYITHLAETRYDEELVCDIVSNSHDMIHDIVEKYFSRIDK